MLHFALWLSILWTHDYTGGEVQRRNFFFISVNNFSPVYVVYRETPHAYETFFEKRNRTGFMFSLFYDEKTPYISAFLFTM